MLSNPKIKDFLTSFSYTPQEYPGNFCTISTIQQATFSSLTNVVVAQGTYTPNNDYIDIIGTPGTPAVTPNFMILICTGQINVTAQTTGGNALVTSAPVFKVFYLLFPAGASGSQPIARVYFDGRTTLPLPMPQGVAVDYYVISGNTILS